MKLLKTLSLLLFIFSFNLDVSGQKAFSENDYIKTSFKLLESKFKKVGVTPNLSDAQVLKLEKVFAEKGKKYNSIITKYQDKGDLADAFMALEKEYNPKIEAILDKDQKEAFRNAIQPNKVAMD
jgi:hypothetical protein